MAIAPPEIGQAEPPEQTAGNRRHTCGLDTHSIAANMKEGKLWHIFTRTDP